MNLKTYTASQARANLYNLIKIASQGLEAIEITLKNNKPVVMISKTELEEWLETLDIINNKEEVKAIKSGQKTKTKISHQQMIKELGLDDKLL